MLKPASHNAQVVQLHRQLAANTNAIEEAMQTLDALIRAPESRSSLAQIRLLRASYVASTSRVLGLMTEGRQAEAVNLVNAEMLDAQEALQRPLKRLLEWQLKNLPIANSEARRQLDSALTLLTTLDGAPSAIWRSSSENEL